MADNTQDKNNIEICNRMSRPVTLFIWPLHGRAQQIRLPLIARASHLYDEVTRVLGFPREYIRLLLHSREIDAQDERCLYYMGIRPNTTLRLNATLNGGGKKGCPQRKTPAGSKTTKDKAGCADDNGRKSAKGNGKDHGRWKCAAAEPGSSSSSSSMAHEHGKGVRTS